MRHDDDETWKLETESRQDTQVSRVSQDRDMKMNKNLSADETANVNFTQCARKLPEFAEITQNDGNYAFQGHSRSPILVPIESSYTISY